LSEEHEDNTMVKRILVGLGGTPFTAVAIQRGVELAKLHDAQLTGVSIVDVKRLTNVGPVPLGGGPAARDLRRQRLRVTLERVEEAIAELQAACGAAGVRCDVLREQGDPFELMLSSSRYHDLTIFGLRSVFEYGVLGETEYDPGDVLTRLITGGVRPIVAVSAHYWPIHRVLIAYSGSVESAKTMRRFVQLKLWPNVTLQIVSLQHPEEKARTLLADAAEYCRAHGFEPEVKYLPGSPKEQLLSEADSWQADLIVMGSGARSLLLRRLFGDTALHVIRNADRPLFLAQ
jgi:nucleotide-binding universal stress UspA family protein